MRPLTLTTPKPMLEVLGKPLLAHTIDSLPKEVTEIIIVVGYLKDQIKNYFGSEWKGRKITYVEQPQKLGTYNALELCKPFIHNGRFLVLYADDLFSPSTYEALVNGKGMLVTVAEVSNPERFGVITLNPDDTIKEIEEKPKHPKTNLANAGPTVVTSAIFNYPPPKHPTGEYFFSEAVSILARHEPVHVVRAEWWLIIGYPEDLKKAETFLKQKS